MTIDELRDKYKEVHPEGKKPFAGWDEAELQSKIAELEGKSVTQAKEEKTYKLTEEQLQRLVSGERPNNIFEQDLEPVEEGAPSKRTYTCTIALWRKDADSPYGVVTDLKTIRHDQDPQTKLYNIDIIRATITYEDGKTEDFEYPIGDHIKIFTVKETVEIVHEDRKKMKMDKGMIYKAKTKKEQGIVTRMAGELSETMVPMRERFLIPIITIRRRNGQELTLPPRVINI